MDEAANIARVCGYLLVKSRERGVVERVDAVGRSWRWRVKCGGREGVNETRD